MEKEGNLLELSAKEKTRMKFSGLMDIIEAIPWKEPPYIKFGEKREGIDSRILLLKCSAGGLQARQWVAFCVNGILEAIKGDALLQGHSSIDYTRYDSLRETMKFFISSVGNDSFSRKISYENGDIFLHLIEDHSYPDIGRITLKANPHIGIKTLKEAFMRSMSSKEPDGKNEEIKPVREDKKRTQAEKLRRFIVELTQADCP